MSVISGPASDELLDLVALELPIQNSNPDLSIQHPGPNPDEQVAVRPGRDAQRKGRPLDHCSGTMVILVGRPGWIEPRPGACSMASRDTAPSMRFCGPAGTGQCVDISVTAIDNGLRQAGGIVVMRKLPDSIRRRITGTSC